MEEANRKQRECMKLLPVLRDMAIIAALYNKEGQIWHIARNVAYSPKSVAFEILRSEILSY